jgi:hypothetical protein
MFQELLIADLVVADLSFDNPNVWYELGVRHGLNARDIVLISIKRDKNPFDIYTDRKLQYNLKDGAPDPATLEEDKKNLGRMARETVESWHGRKISPVYSLLSKLEEPEWKKLILDQDSEFGEISEIGKAASKWRSRNSVRGITWCWLKRPLSSHCDWRRGGQRPRL